MRHLTAYVHALEAQQHPAAALGRFLLEHSNSPEYLAQNLAAFAAQVEQDLEQERQFARRLLTLTRESP